MNKKKKIILASGSPRRKELMEQIGLSFQVYVSNADETTVETNPGKIVEELSFKKAEAVYKELTAAEKKDLTLNEELLVIGADTIVALDGQILGKPKSPDQAKEMLRMLSGKKHQVYTGVTLIWGEGEQQRYSFSEETNVEFRELLDQEIEEYVATGDPLDKAGSYGIQGFCARYIKGIQGDYFNVVGLPVGALYQAMKEKVPEAL